METKRIILDGPLLAQRDQAMELLGRALELPPWWGRNLDALSDCLWDLGQPVCLEITDHLSLAGCSFGQKLLLVLRLSAQQNDLFTLCLR